jgi:hypothetical protein
MLNGYGWCVLQAMEPRSVDAIEPDEDRADALEEAANQRLWADIRAFMAAHHPPSPTLRWHLTEQLNNDRGVLLFHVSCNHTTQAWNMLTWIAENGRGSYGLFYVHDDEDDGAYRRATDVDNSNTFRVYRLIHGELTELDDPFLGEVFPRLRR